MNENGIQAGMCLGMMGWWFALGLPPMWIGAGFIAALIASSYVISRIER